MRIAVVVSTYPPYAGGMGNVAAAHVQALKEAGHEVTVLAPGAGLSSYLRIRNAAIVPQLLWKLRGFDAVELHYPFFGAAEWVLAWKRLFGRHTRLVTCYHMDAVGDGVTAPVFALYRTLFLKAIMDASDRVIVTSRDYAASSDIAGTQGETKAIEVPLSVDTERFVPSVHPPASPTALFVGALDSAHYFKGIPVLLRAFAEVSEHHSDARLVIAGDGDCRAGYEAEARKLGLGDRVKFLGKVPDARLPETYRQASFHVLPSVDRSEAFGLVTLEAAASGIPSVVSDLPGVRSVIAQGETGTLVAPNDVTALAQAMSRLFSDPVLARKMGQAARRRAEQRYAKETVDRLIVRAVVE